AVLCAAHQVPACRAVVTVGAPAEPAHVTHLIQSEREVIEARGEAEVSIGGRPFVISKQFLDDLEENRIDAHIRNLDRALLVLHSPQDRTVEVENARKIYNAARHPKSFVSLDGADHLLMREEDARYVGDVIATWSTRYVSPPPPAEADGDLDVDVRLDEGFTTFVRAGRHHFVADEPKSVGGEDLGPTPYHLLSASLGTCTAMTLRMYADRKGWPLREVAVHLHHDKAYDCDRTDDPDCRVDRISREIELDGDLDDAQRAKLLEIADKCPVHKTLRDGVQVFTDLKASEADV
ncbi:MAG: bifunctional alpha/beta hydrolase/OsmC family protein, partial [Catalinimonas sp.]